MGKTATFKKIGSALLLVIFLFGIVPPEYLHDIFAGHDDGVDPILKKGEVVFMPKHTHCSFLGFEYEPFTVPTPTFVFLERIVHHVRPICVHYHFLYTNQHNAVALRGPPSFIPQVLTA